MTANKKSLSAAEAALQCVLQTNNFESSGMYPAANTTVFYNLLGCPRIGQSMI